MSWKQKNDPQGLALTECRVKQYQQLVWSDDMWREYVGSDNLRTWVAWHGGAIARYYELLRQNDNVEIITKVPLKEIANADHSD